MRKLTTIALCAVLSSCATAPPRAIRHVVSWKEEADALEAKNDLYLKNLEASNARMLAELNRQNAKAQADYDATMADMRAHPGNYAAPSPEEQSSFETRELANEVRNLKLEVVNASLRNNL
jgi:hypothetical protein